MTINELLAAAGLTGDDVIPMYDAEAPAGTEPTQKIKASDFVSAMKTLGSLLSQSDVVNNLTSGGTTVPLSAEMGKQLGADQTQLIKIVQTQSTKIQGGVTSGSHNYLAIPYTVPNGYKTTGISTITPGHPGSASYLTFNGGVNPNQTGAQTVYVMYNATGTVAEGYTDIVVNIMCIKITSNITP